jgi:hypothetical protein
LAKVYRDRLLVEWDSEFPGYGLARHKGYGSPEHLAALARLGPTPLHRKSFHPVSQTVLRFEKIIQIEATVEEFIDAPAAEEPPVSKERFACPCCGNFTLAEKPPGSLGLCEVCWWEDDPVQFADPNYEGGANAPSLNQAREFFRTIAVSDPELRGHERQPRAEEMPRGTAFLPFID